MEKNLSKFRINFVSQNTKLKVNWSGPFAYFKLYLEEKEVDNLFDFLNSAVVSIPDVKKDLTQKPAKQNKDYHYVLTTEHGSIRFEINYGGKCEVDQEHPPTISLETSPYIPDSKFLAEIKPIVKHLIEKTGFKAFFWDALRFVESDELYGRMKK